MYEFLDRLVNVALPRVRDFRGLNPKSFDGRGNYAMGIKEHIIFPEINYDKVDQVWGMDVIVCTTAKTDDEARALAQGVQLPVPAVRTGTMAKKSCDREEQAAPQDGGAATPNAAPTLKASPTTRACRWRSASRRASSSPSCRAIPSPMRIRNRCEVTGRPRGYYRKLKMSRIALRELGSAGSDPRPGQVELVRRRPQ